MRYKSLVAAALVAGCVQDAPKLYWVHPDLAPEQAQTREVMDAAECKASAFAAIALPILPNVENTSIVVQGSTLGTSPGPYSPEHRLMERQITLLDQQSALLDATVAAREEFAEACMMRRGWRREILVTADG